ncbi:phage repressor protein CI [Escherichia coli]|uniref:phage repressor protein CI n=1 Tax=Escherichia coli TaxID=562 RepID=UPI0024ACD66F|nr:phage repressor protein CI [Escherichia coli]WHH07214.1 phage repressor protein CI [Escherichia coli]
MSLEKGGRGAIERMVEAYGFKTRQALCDHLGISKSTLATRYMRDSFPAEWVIQCALETGTSLNWLTTGHGSKQTSGNTNTMEVAKYVLSDGALCEDGFYIFDREFLPSAFKNLFVITDNNSEFICDKEFDDIRDGKWVISIDGEITIRDITRLPGGRIFVEGGNRAFECKIEDIEIIGKIISLTVKYVK